MVCSALDCDSEPGGSVVVGDDLFVIPMCLQHLSAWTSAMIPNEWEWVTRSRPDDAERK